MSVLFSIKDSIARVSDFVTYARIYRYKSDGSGTYPYEKVMDNFVHDNMYNYYRTHLEDFNETFRNQMKEFSEGNLFFEIMQREIWNKAQADSTALLALYEKNKKNYTWKASADAVIFFCSDLANAKIVYEEVKKNPADWKSIAEKYNEKVASDNSRYEMDQIPNADKMTLQAGMITSPVINKSDNTASFAYVLKVYPQPTTRTFNEARGLVINDYQDYLEAEWIKALKKKYPVAINQKVLADISK
jgi:peptidyl-prolyl cis-trans isomerase SurA